MTTAYVEADKWYCTSTYSGDVVEGPFDTKEAAEREFDLGRAIESGRDLIDDGRYDALGCLQEHEGDCAGTVELRESLTGTGTRIPRCDKHWEDRLDLEEQLNERYPATPPSGWSPLDAGERWDEDDPWP